VSAAALVPATFVASPASAAIIPNLTITSAGVWEGGTATFTVTYTGTTSSGSVAFDTAGSVEDGGLTATKGTDFTGTPSVASYTFPGTAAGGTNSITVTVDNAGAVYFDDALVSLDALPARLATIKAAYAEPSLHLRADERVPYGSVAKVMAAVEHAGISKVSVLTDNQ
jgi:hypothetical protein